MSQSWQANPGQYILQQQTLGQSSQGGASGPGGVQTVVVAPPTAEAHYGYTNLSDGTAAPNPSGPLLLDGPTSSTLPNRISMEFYNAGADDFEVYTNGNATFGTAQGRTVKAGATYTVAIGPANVSGGVKHYALCTSGKTCIIEISEVGQ